MTVEDSSGCNRNQLDEVDRERSLATLRDDVRRLASRIWHRSLSLSPKERNCDPLLACLVQQKACVELHVQQLIAATRHLPREFCDWHMAKFLNRS